ncbi:hypothetical protein HPB48_013003 [Haemaphysalis longicornis]|uniref:Uncharacterized protein n=1 Tax=Haemaphysalis longicornis TaxID=44386 RepID=A0A9J6FHY5_HAELO|nr:hypothetical protein HPB48_013003 [Haemaphysalis longicornis]
MNTKRDWSLPRTIIQPPPPVHPVPRILLSTKQHPNTLAEDLRLLIYPTSTQIPASVLPCQDFPPSPLDHPFTIQEPAPGAQQPSSQYDTSERSNNL